MSQIVCRSSENLFRFEQVESLESLESGSVTVLSRRATSLDLTEVIIFFLYRRVFVSVSYASSFSVPLLWLEIVLCSVNEKVKIRSFSEVSLTL